MASASESDAWPIGVLDIGDWFQWGADVYEVCASPPDAPDGDSYAINLRTGTRVCIFPQMVVRIMPRPPASTKEP